MKSVSFGIRRNFPTLRHAGNRVQIMRIFADQTLKQRGNDVQRADTVDELWIEVLNFLPVAFVQNLEAIAFLDVGFNALAARTQEYERKEPQICTKFHGRVVAALVSSAEPKR